MSKPKFTPGPWRVFNETSVGTGKVRVADCEDIEVGFGRGADKYNATLIAAAPEMLNELEVVQKAMLAIAEYSADEEIKESARQHAAHINIVVKKASGEK